MLSMFGGGAVMAFIAAVIGLRLGLVGTLPAPAWPWVSVAITLGLAFLASNLALQYGAARLRASTTSLIMLTEVVYASVSAMLLGAGEFSLRTLIGGAFILLASLLAVVNFKPS